MYSYAARFARLMQSAGGLSPGKLLGLIFHLPNFIRLFWRLMNDNRVPLHLRLICWGSIIYFFFPFDLLRDFPFFLTGRVDDVFFLVYAFRKLIKECPPEIVYDHVQAISERR